MRNNIFWIDSYGRAFRTPMEIEDTHLANIIDFLNKNSNTEERKNTLEVCLREAKRRGLSDDFLNCAEIPHKNPKSGVWMLWDVNNNRPMPISKNGATQCLK